MSPKISSVSKNIKTYGLGTTIGAAFIIGSSIMMFNTVKVNSKSNESQQQMIAQLLKENKENNNRILDELRYSRQVNKDLAETNNSITETNRIIVNEIVPKLASIEYLIKLTADNGNIIFLEENLEKRGDNVNGSNTR